MDTTLETTNKLLLVIIITFHAMDLHVNLFLYKYMTYHLSQAQHLTEFQLLHY